ncbi:MAG: hypothetical protein AAF502_16560, partial [Bacteroidota bacterium]
MSNGNHLIDLTQYKDSLKNKYKSDLGKINIEDGPIKVLYIGKTIQQPMLGPFIEAIGETGGVQKKDVEVYTIYNVASKGFNNGPFVQSEPFTTEELKQFHPKVTAVEDLGNYSLDEFNLKTEFTIIFCCFEMQYAMNWRFALIKLLKVLTKGGILYFSELGGDISILNGQFGNLSNDVDQVLENFLVFKTRRNEKYYWSPEISITDYKEKEKFLWKMFDQVEEKTFIADNKIPLTTDNILNYHRDSFTFLSHGMSPSESETLISECFEIKQVELSHSFKLYSAIGFKLIQNESRFSTRDSNSLAESIQTVNDYSLESIGKK